MSNENSRERLVVDLIAANRTYQQANDAIDHAAYELLGINRTDGHCVDILQQRRRISAGELAVAAGLSPGAVTAALDRLERAGYARRVRDPDDRRRVLVEATELAHDLARQIYGPLVEMGAAIVEALSDREVRVITEFMRDASDIQRRRAGELREWFERDGPLNATTAAEPDGGPVG